MTHTLKDGTLDPMYPESIIKSKKIKVKSYSDIKKRLRKLKFRYLRSHLKISQDRLFENCVHGYYHYSSPIPQKPKVAVSGTLVPHHQVTLVVLQDEDKGPAPLCMYGSDDPNSWSGDMCLGDKPKSCSVFKPRVSMESAQAEFTGSLEDDKFVYDNMKDVAALQWVVNERVAFWKLSLLEKISLWFMKFFFRRPKLLPTSTEELSDDLWNDKS